jgi:hypothetical protein
MDVPTNCSISSSGLEFTISNNGSSALIIFTVCGEAIKAFNICSKHKCHSKGRTCFPQLDDKVIELFSTFDQRSSAQ